MNATCDVYSRPTSRCCERRSRGAPGTCSMPPWHVSCAGASAARPALLVATALVRQPAVLHRVQRRRRRQAERRRLARAPSPRELDAVLSQRHRESQRSVSPSTVGHHCAAVPSRTRSVRREAGEVVGGGVASLQRAPSCSRGQHHAALKHQIPILVSHFRSRPT